MTFRRFALLGIGRRADQPRGVDVVPQEHRRRRCPIVDTWWQTETGGIMITPLPGITATKPGAAMTPFPGIAADVVDNDGKPVGNGEGGYLVITEPWPAMLRGSGATRERYKETYWSRFPGLYFAGDGAKKDEDGDLWLLGRVDDVMNISGHRISTTEVEHALVGHPKVAEAAVVGATDPITGQAIVAFVTVKGNVPDDESQGAAFAAELRAHVAKEIGAIAKPRDILHHPRPAEDALRQDHAPAAARRRRTPHARRHHDAARPERRQLNRSPDAGLDRGVAARSIFRGARPRPLNGNGLTAPPASNKLDRLQPSER